MIQKIFACCLVIISSFIPAIAEGSTQVSAVVNHKMISSAQLDARLRLALLSGGMDDTPELRKHLEPQILKSMIEEALKIQEAEKFDVQASKESIEAAFNDIERNNNMEAGALKAMLEKNKIPPEVMYDQIRSNIVWQEYIRGRFYQTVQLDDVEISKALEEAKNMVVDPKDLVGEIFLAVDDPSQESKIRQQALDLIQNLKKGARFSMLAQQFSNAASAAKGGDIGWVRRGSLEEAYNKALTTLTPGSVTLDPIRTQNGYAILMLRDQRAAGESPEKQTLVTFKQLLVPKNKITSEFDFEKLMGKMQSISQSAKNCSMYSQMASSHPAFKMQEIKEIPETSLMPQLQEIFSKLSLEKASQPIVSDIGIISFMVCNRQVIDPKEPTRDQMRAILMEKKLSLISQREIRNLKRAAFIDIRS